MVIRAQCIVALLIPRNCPRESLVSQYPLVESGFSVGLKRLVLTDIDLTELDIRMGLQFTL
jgi:hypothetical protein